MPAPRKPKPPRSRTPQSSQQSTTPELVDPRWILKALGIVLFIALLCAWGTLCLLWYQGQWQLVLHPSRMVFKPGTSLFTCSDTRFFVDAVGNTQLDARRCPYWSDSEVNAQFPQGFNPKFPTVLFLHGADGDIDEALPRVQTLNDAHLNVLLFDYRGYGRSAGRHPTQATMQEDAEAALKFLLNENHIPASQIILYGQGIGASLAVRLAAQHHDIPAIILDAPDGDLTDRVIRDAHSSLVPARLLFHEDFPLAEPLRTLSTPKLLITYTTATKPPATLAQAADPKVTVELPSPNATNPLTNAIQRFLDQYVH